jgi:hypothetical protein
MARAAARCRCARAPDTPNPRPMKRREAAGEAAGAQARAAPEPELQAWRGQRPRAPHPARWARLQQRRRPVHPPAARPWVAAPQGSCTAARRKSRAASRRPCSQLPCATPAATPGGRWRVRMCVSKFSHNNKTNTRAQHLLRLSRRAGAGGHRRASAVPLLRTRLCGIVARSTGSAVSAAVLRSAAVAAAAELERAARREQALPARAARRSAPPHARACAASTHASAPSGRTSCPACGDAPVEAAGIAAEAVVVLHPAHARAGSERSQRRRRRLAAARASHGGTRAVLGPSRQLAQSRTHRQSCPHGWRAGAGRGASSRQLPPGAFVNDAVCAMQRTSTREPPKPLKPAPRRARVVSSTRAHRSAAAGAARRTAVEEAAARDAAAAAHVQQVAPGLPRRAASAPLGTTRLRAAGRAPRCCCRRCPCHRQPRGPRRWSEALRRCPTVARPGPRRRSAPSRRPTAPRRTPAAAGRRSAWRARQDGSETAHASARAARQHGSACARGVAARGRRGAPHGACKLGRGGGRGARRGVKQCQEPPKTGAPFTS